MALSKVGLIADSTSLTGATLTNANAAGTFTIDQGSSNTNIFSDSVNFTANTTFTGNVSFASATVTMKENWNIVNSNNVTLAVGKNYAANTRAGALTLNLPSSASIGDVIQVIDHEGLASTANNITIAKNGHKIDGFERNAVLNTNRGGIKLVYVSAGVGWMSDKKQQETQVHRFQGEVSGYTAGGNAPPDTVTIDKFPFAVDANATDVGDLTQARSGVAGQSSSISGYSSGGNSGSYSNVIDKFPFAIDGNASDVGDLTQAKEYGAGHSSQTFGYHSGGATDPAPTRSNIIDKFPFAINASASDVGDMTQAKSTQAGQSSEEAGYVSGGNAPPFSNNVERFPFASDANAQDVCNLTVARAQVAGQSSTTHGYTSGGEDSPSTASNVIDKFPFATDSNATDVGDLASGTRRLITGISSTNFGYNSSGYTPSPGARVDIIEKFSFTTEFSSTDVGNLTQARYGGAGQQV